MISLMSRTLFCFHCGHIWIPRKSGRPVQCPRCHSATWDRAINPDIGYFHQIAATLNRLKRGGVFGEWVIYGAVAYIFHEEPIETGDMDVLVLVDSDDDYVYQVLPALEEVGRHTGKQGTFLIHGLPVQVLSSTSHRVYEEVVRLAINGKIGDQPVKVASREHLIFLGLVRFEPKDWGRVVQLHRTANRRKLRTILERFDESGEFRRRLHWLLSGYS